MYVCTIVYTLTHGRLQAQERQGQEEGDFQEVWKKHPTRPPAQTRTAGQK